LTAVKSEGMKVIVHRQESMKKLQHWEQLKHLNSDRSVNGRIVLCAKSHIRSQSTWFSTKRLLLSEEPFDHLTTLLSNGSCHSIGHCLVGGAVHLRWDRSDGLFIFDSCLSASHSALFMDSWGRFKSGWMISRHAVRWSRIEPHEKVQFISFWLWDRFERLTPDRNWGFDSLFVASPNQVSDDSVVDFREMTWVSLITDHFRSKVSESHLRQTSFANGVCLSSKQSNRDYLSFDVCLFRKCR
jgi:hypothetical protein